MASWPTLRELRTFLRLQPDSTEDAVLEDARAASIDFGIRRLGGKWPADTTELPEAAHEAALIDAARLYKRRDSIDGTIGWGDMGIIRVGRGDPDAARLYDQLAPVVFG